MSASSTAIDTRDGVLRLDAMRQKVYLSLLTDRAWHAHRKDDLPVTLLLELYPGPLGYDDMLVAIHRILFRFCWDEARTLSWHAVDTLVAVMLRQLESANPNFPEAFHRHPYYKVDDDLESMAGPHILTMVAILSECLTADPPAYDPEFLAPIAKTWFAFRDALRAA